MIIEIFLVLVAAAAVSDLLLVDMGIVAALFLLFWLVWMKKRKGWKRLSEWVERFSQPILKFYGRRVSVNTAIMVLSLLLILLIQTI